MQTVGGIDTMIAYAKKMEIEQFKMLKLLIVNRLDALPESGSASLLCDIMKLMKEHRAKTE